MKSKKSRLVGASGKRRFTRPVATGVAVAAVAAGATGLAVPAASASTSTNITLLPTTAILNAIPLPVQELCGFSGLSISGLNAAVSKAPHVTRGQFGAGGKAGLFFSDPYTTPIEPLCETEDLLEAGAYYSGVAPSTAVDAAAHVADAITNWDGYSQPEFWGYTIPLPSEGSTSVKANETVVNNDLKVAANDLQQLFNTNTFDSSFSEYFFEGLFTIYGVSLNEASALYQAATGHYGSPQAEPLIAYVAGTAETAGGNAIYNSGAFNTAVSDDINAVNLLYSWGVTSEGFFEWYWD